MDMAFGMPTSKRGHKGQSGLACQFPIDFPNSISSEAVCGMPCFVVNGSSFRATTLGFERLGEDEKSLKKESELCFEEPATAKLVPCMCP